MKKRLLMAVCALLALSGVLVSSEAAAAPITYTMTVPLASGSNNGIAFTGQTLLITVTADTSQIVAAPGMIGGPGNCVPATSLTISVSNGGIFQATAPMFFCATLNGLITGIFNNNTGAGTFYFIADFSNAGITNFALASGFPKTINVPTHTAATNTPLNLVGGGTASITVVPANGATFAVAGGVPTLGEYALMILAALLAIAGAMTLRRRTQV